MKQNWLHLSIGKGANNFREEYGNSDYLGMAPVLATPIQSAGCIQNRINRFCVTNSGFPYARYNREKGKWRCYDMLDGDGETARECMNDSRFRIQCERHADGSPYLQMQNQILAEIADTCERNYIIKICFRL